jgi:hypothetical protein
VKLPLFALASVVLFCIVAPAAHASAGVHIVIIQPGPDGAWEATEFIDNALVREMAEPVGESGAILRPSLRSMHGQAAIPVTSLTAEQVPLLIFCAENTEALESRINGAGQTIEAIELEKEFQRQMLAGLFQVPFWPYIAASEVPGQGIDMERGRRLPYMRQDMFAAPTFAGVGAFNGWTITGYDTGGVLLVPSSEAGEGKGIVLEYTFQNADSDIGIGIPSGAAVDALYVMGDRAWKISAPDSRLVTTGDLIGLLDESTMPDLKGLPVASVHIRDEQGMLGRLLVAPSISNAGAGLSWVQAGTDGPGGATSVLSGNWTQGQYVLAILACWVCFGLVVLGGNLLYRFTTMPVLILLAISMGAYILFLLVSLLTSGLWGMGFVIGASVLARLLAPEGRRLGAFGVIAAASFAAAFLSMAISGQA